MSTPGRFTIGHLARETGCKVQTIRYYEQIGLMTAAARTHGNQRVYGDADVRRLAFIRHGRELGFPLNAVRALLGLADDPNQPCRTADAIARTHLHQVESRIERLQALKRELERMVRQCAGGHIGQCRVIEVLADHAQCLEMHHAPVDKG